MENYELTFIINATVPETEHKVIQDKVLDYIKEIKGTITKKTHSLGRKKLAYPIKKQNHGFYISLEFESEEKDNLVELDTKLKHNDNILRHLIIKKPFIKEEKKEDIKIKEIVKEEKKEESKEEVIKIDLDDIDEKLDNILEK